MNSQFKDIYGRYGNRRMSASDFRTFKTDLDSISDDELWSIMMIMDGYDQSNACDCMTPNEKSRILRRLHGYIMRRRWLTALKYAAVVAVVLCAGYGTYSVMSVSEDTNLLTTSVKAGSKSETTLPDGTVVQLNGASSISYNFNDDGIRMVHLTGEGFFNVAKDQEHPFRVTVGDLCVEVLGTTFNINAYNPDIIETSLLTGSISISGESLQENYLLYPGEKAVYCKSEHSLVIAQADPHVSTGWLDDYLVFDSETLAEVIKKIERWYAVKIDLQCDTIETDRLSGSFRRENIDNVMRSLSVQYKFKYKIDKDHIIIY